ncbi:serine hydrolase domain-containing protein [Deinococcus pimensis]|uniref:serine hydrolase domain-containing protein n=1 Tax=Deinococcus pimensis TaxID=309888 RepID=UPI0004AD4766|nr:serine hydrolase domain-containing protein [Deinococcus pimensis]
MDSPPARTGTGQVDDPALEDAARLVTRDLPHVTSLLVARHGRTVLERYWNCAADDPQDLQSITKTLIGTLCGTLIHRGVLPDARANVLEFFPEFTSRVRDPRWTDVTVEHLLTMTGGLPSELTDEAYDDAWFGSEDPIAFALEHELQGAPGETFRYSNAGTHVLGELLARAAGTDLATLLQDTLLTPLGVRLADWPRDPRGRPFGCGYVRLTPRALLRFGIMVAHGGRADDRLVAPTDWLRTSTRPRVRGYAWMEGIDDYGYLWWVTREHDEEGWYATGFGGQYLAVFPRLDLVVVMTGSTTPHPSHRYVIGDLILPIIQDAERQARSDPGTGET